MNSVEEMIDGIINGIKNQEKELSTQYIGKCWEYCKAINKLPNSVADGVKQIIKNVFFLLFSKLY